MELSKGKDTANIDRHRLFDDLGTSQLKSIRSDSGVARWGRVIPFKKCIIFNYNIVKYNVKRKPYYTSTKTNHKTKGDMNKSFIKIWIVKIKSAKDFGITCHNTFKISNVNINKLWLSIYLLCHIIIFYSRIMYY